MNKEQAKAWLPLIQALAEGKTIQLNVCTVESPIWRNAQGISTHSDLLGCYRIKPEPKKQWYRVGLVEKPKGNFYTISADHDEAEEAWVKSSEFIKWLTDRIEYELPEGEA